MKNTSESSCKALYFIYGSIIDFLYVSKQTTPMCNMQKRYLKKKKNVFSITV